MNALKYAHLIGRHVKMNLDITLFDAEDAPDGCGVVESVYDWHDGSAVEVNFTNKQTVTILPGDAGPVAVLDQRPAFNERLTRRWRHATPGHNTTGRRCGT